MVLIAKLVNSLPHILSCEAAFAAGWRVEQSALQHTSCCSLRVRHRQMCHCVRFRRYLELFAWVYAGIVLYCVPWKCVLCSTVVSSALLLRRQDIHDCRVLCCWVYFCGRGAFCAWVRSHDGFVILPRTSGREVRVCIYLLAAFLSRSYSERTRARRDLPPMKSDQLLRRTFQLPEVHCVHVS